MFGSEMAGPSTGCPVVIRRLQFAGLVAVAVALAVAVGVAVAVTVAVAVAVAVVVEWEWPWQWQWEAAIAVGLGVGVGAVSVARPDLCCIGSQARSAHRGPANAQPASSNAL